MRMMSGLVGAVLLVGLAAAPAAASSAAAAPAGDERISSYGVELEVRPDGSLRVEETIDYDIGGNARHGIERDIDTEQKFDGGHNRRYPVSEVRVSSETAPDQVDVTDSGGSTRLRIGDPDRTITGAHTYVISYTVAAATTRFDDRDELYWNAVGPDWDVPIDEVDVRVTGAQVTRAACYAGEPGGTAPCGSAESSGSTATYSGGPVAAGDALTVVAAFPAGSVAAAPPVLVERRTPRSFLVGDPAFALPVSGLVLGVPVWLLVAGIRRKKAQEAPALAYREGHQPELPRGLRPALAGMLLHGTARPVDAATVLLDLSARGFVSISPLPKDNWRLVAVRPPDASLPPEAHEVFAAAFRRGPDTTLRAASRALVGLRTKLRTIAEAEMLRLGWYRTSPRQKSGLVVLGVLLMFFTLPVLLVTGLAADAGLIGLALGAGGIVLIVHAFTRPAPRTEAGEVARAQLIAFRRTLQGIDPMRLPPGEREARLAGLLPYAVALGLASQLAASFSAAGVVAGGYAGNPMWWSTFAGDATRASTPASSSSGGGGFSGSSGGGGGGGGGGSW